MNAPHTILTVLAAVAIAGCYEGGGGNSADGGTSGGEGTADDGSDGSDGGTDEDPTGAEARCEESRIGPPLLRRLTQREFEETITQLFPEIADVYEGGALGVDTVSALGFGNDAEVLQVSEQVAREILSTAEDVAEAVTSDPIFAQILPCSADAPGEGCASDFIDDYGERMFRRPLSESERSSYLDLFTSVAGEADFATGIHWTIVALLQSPHLVYRSELGAPTDSGDRALEGWELATAIAYDFSGGPPDAQLRDLGASGALDDPTIRVDEARRLLATDRGRVTLSRFFQEWLDYSDVATKSRAEVPEFEAVRDAMAEETRRFIESVVVEDAGDVRDLLLSDYTAVDGALASYYGFGNASGDFEVVPRPEAWGVGLLAQGSLLAANAHVGASSPTRRGLLVYERLLCQERPPVPEDIPPLEPPSPGTSTTRERYEDQHMANAGCRSCHALFDPIGFAFEHFDEAGRFRPDEAGLAIDATGNLPPGLVAEETKFDGLTELSESLAAQPEVTDCVTGLVAAYVFGGAGGTACLAEDARTAVVDEEYGLAEFVAQLAAAPHFSQRRP